MNVADGQWHHVAVTWSDDGTPDIADAKLYVDGQLDTGGSSSGCSINTASEDDVCIGKSIHDKPFLGLIDDVRIYARAMSTEEIKTLIHLYKKSFRSPLETG